MQTTLQTEFTFFLLRTTFDLLYFAKAALSMPIDHKHNAEQVENHRRIGELVAHFEREADQIVLARTGLGVLIDSRYFVAWLFDLNISKYVREGEIFSLKKKIVITLTRENSKIVVQP